MKMTKGMFITGAILVGFSTVVTIGADIVIPLLQHKWEKEKDAQKNEESVVGFDVTE